MSDNLINKSIDWSINALSRSNNDIKSPNWLFRIINCVYIFYYICLFFDLYTKNYSGGV